MVAHPAPFAGRPTPAAFTVVAQRVRGAGLRATREVSVGGETVGRLEYRPAGSGTAELSGGSWVLGRVRRTRLLRRRMTGEICDAAGVAVARLELRSGARELLVTFDGFALAMSRPWSVGHWTATTGGAVVATVRNEGLLASRVIVDVTAAGTRAPDPRLLVIGLLHAVECWHRDGSGAGATG